MNDDDASLPDASHDAPEPSPRWPFIDNYLAALLGQASHLVSHEFHQIIRQQGLTVLQWRILATLSDGRSQSVGAVAQLIVTPQPTVSRVVDEMQALGLITRQPDTLDRRISLLRLTPGGQRIAARLIRTACAHEKAVLAPISADEARALKRALRKVIALRRVAAERAAATDRTAPTRSTAGPATEPPDTGDDIDSAIGDEPMN